MKKTIFYALIAVILFTFVSCEQTVDEKKLLGKWALIEYATAEYVNDCLMESSTVAIEKEENAFIEFLPDGQYMSSIWNRGTYSISSDGSRIYLTDADPDGGIDGYGGAFNYAITNLTKSNLELLYVDIDKDHMYPDRTYKLEVFYRFVKE